MNQAFLVKATAIPMSVAKGGGYTIPGEGQVDWQQVIRRLEESCCDGVLSVELEDHHFAPLNYSKKGWFARKNTSSNSSRGDLDWEDLRGGVNLRVGAAGLVDTRYCAVYYTAHPL